MAGMRSCGPCDCETRQDSGREQPDQASGPSTHGLPAQCGTHPHSRLWQTQRACCLGVRDSTQRGCQAFEQVIAVEFIWLPGAGEAGLSAGACDQPRAHSSGPCPPTCVLCCRRGFCSAQSLRGWWPATRHLGATGRRVDEFADDQASRAGGGGERLPSRMHRGDRGGPANVMASTNAIVHPRGVGYLACPSPQSTDCPGLDCPGSREQRA